MTATPTTAPDRRPPGRRTDLTFLRHRARPRPAPQAAGPAPSGAPVIGLSPPDAPPAAPVLLTPPAAPPPATDLAPTVPLAPPVAQATLVETSTRHTPLPPLLPGIPQVRGTERRVLTVDAPVVMLDRVQSGVGPLRVQVVSSSATTMAVAFEIDGAEGLLVAPEGGYAPDHHRPVVALGDAGLSVDLGRIRHLSRFVVVLRSGCLDGTLVVTTLGGARLEVPLDHDATPDDDLVALSGYVVHGALVLRAEMDPQGDGFRGATAAFGYDEITWCDKDTPVR